jgi:hypothetical protein
MKNKIQRYGVGIRVDEYDVTTDNGEETHTIINLDPASIMDNSISASKIDLYSVPPNSIMMSDHQGNMIWKTQEALFTSQDTELREKYPSLEISWKRVLEALHEYEMVKKLVKDY